MPSHIKKSAGRVINSAACFPAFIPSLNEAPGTPCAFRSSIFRTGGINHIKTFEIVTLREMPASRDGKSINACAIVRESDDINRGN